MLKYLSIAGVVLVADQVSKWFALKMLFAQPEIKVAPFLSLVLVYNAGAAFGFLSDASGWQNMLFVGIALIACIVILAMTRRLGVNDIQVMVGLMLILGGALGNLIDRVRFGYVVDFIDVYYPGASCLWPFSAYGGGCHWPAFNIADSAITIGAVLLVLDALGWGFKPRHGEG